MRSNAPKRPADKPRKPAQPKKKRRIKSYNLSTALWLWCFPVGLSKMWRARCTWPKGVKIGITAAMAAILLAVFIIPDPGRHKAASGVELVSGNPEAEVYGPALPAVMLTSYTAEASNSIIVDESSKDVHYVYAADGARCYHEYDCKFAFASSQRLTVYEAYHLGFEPCGRCNPPVYVPGVTDPITAKPLADEAAAQPVETEAVEGSGT